MSRDPFKAKGSPVMAGRIIERLLHDLSELREGLGDQAFDDRITAGLENICAGYEFLGWNPPPDLVFNLCPVHECGEPTEHEEGNVYATCPNGHKTTTGDKF